MQMNVRNALNGASGIGIKTQPLRERSCSFAVPVPFSSYPLLNASAKNEKDHFFALLSVFRVATAFTDTWNETRATLSVLFRKLGGTWGLFNIELYTNPERSCYPQK